MADRVTVSLKAVSKQKAVLPISSHAGHSYAQRFTHFLTFSRTTRYSDSVATEPQPFSVPQRRREFIDTMNEMGIARCDYRFGNGHVYFRDETNANLVYLRFR